MEESPTQKFDPSTVNALSVASCLLLTVFLVHLDLS